MYGKKKGRYVDSVVWILWVIICRLLGFVLFFSSLLIDRLPEGMAKEGRKEGKGREE